MGNTSLMKTGFKRLPKTIFTPIPAEYYSKGIEMMFDNSLQSIEELSGYDIANNGEYIIE